jgi:DNA repair protein RecO (recombination protein O)
MEAERAEAIVLRRHPVTESSLIVTWFTREFGKLKTIAKGARRPKSPFRGKIDLFYVDEIIFLRSRRSDLHLLQECFLEDPHTALRASVKTVTAASYCSELVEIATEPEDANVKIFQLLSSMLDALERNCEPVLLIWFELQLLAAAGWAPKWQRRTGTSKLLASLATANLTGAQHVRLSREQVHRSRETLWRFWDEHVGRLPRSRSLVAESLIQSA